MGDSNPEKMVCVLTCDLEIRMEIVQISHFQQLRTRPTNDDSHVILAPYGPLILHQLFAGIVTTTQRRDHRQIIQVGFHYNSGGFSL